MDRAGLPALVEPRLQGSNQSIGKRFAGIGPVTLDHRGRHLIIGQQVAGSNHAIAGMDGVNAERVAAGMGRHAPKCIDERKLPICDEGGRCDERVANFIRAQAPRKQVEADLA